MSASASHVWWDGDRRGERPQTLPGTKAASQAQEVLATPALAEAKRLLAGKGTQQQGKKALWAVVDAYKPTAAASEARSILSDEAAKENVDETAERHLRDAKKLIEEEKVEKARERLKEIVEKFPLSKTREEARLLLEKLDQDAKDAERLKKCSDKRDM
jgi:hypothetical protein